jgi:hypothetical protein
MLLRLCIEFARGFDAYPQMISIPLLKSKVGGNFATAAISGLQLQRSLSEETAKVLGPARARGGVKGGVFFFFDFFWVLPPFLGGGWSGVATGYLHSYI